MVNQYLENGYIISLQRHLRCSDIFNFIVFHIEMPTCIFHVIFYLMLQMFNINNNARLNYLNTIFIF